MEIVDRIRVKGGALRILIAGDSRSQVQYVAVEPKTCWAGTFVSWGKAPSDGAYIWVDGKQYVVTLMPISEIKETK